MLPVLSLARGLLHPATAGPLCLQTLPWIPDLEGAGKRQEGGKRCKGPVAGPASDNKQSEKPKSAFISFARTVPWLLGSVRK